MFNTCGKQFISIMNKKENAIISFPPLTILLVQTLFCLIPPLLPRWSFVGTFSVSLRDHFLSKPHATDVAAAFWQCMKCVCSTRVADKWQVTSLVLISTLHQAHNHRNPSNWDTAQAIMSTSCDLPTTLSNHCVTITHQSLRRDGTHTHIQMHVHTDV